MREIENREVFAAIEFEIGKVLGEIVVGEIKGFEVLGEICDKP